MKKNKAFGVIVSTISVVIALFMLMPLIWAFFVSLQREGKAIKSVWDWFAPPYILKNYIDVFFKSNVLLWLKNSVIVSVTATAGCVIMTSMAAYAVAILDFKGKNLVFFYLILGVMVPGQATIVPLFITANKLRLIDTYQGLILPLLVNSMNFIILTTFMKGLPKELIEAARIDGAGAAGIFFKIVFPLVKSALATICIFSFVGSWNDYLWPLLCSMNETIFTLPIGIPTLAGTYSVDFVKPMTANMVASIPIVILYLIFEKKIVQGITMTGVKG